MFRLLAVLFIVIIILLILRSRSKKFNKLGPNSYKKIIFAIIVLGILFFIATTSRYLLPQILQLIKIGLPLITKFIGI